MDRTTRNLFALLLVGVLVLTGGAALILGGPPPAPTSPSAPPDSSTLVGVIVDVQTESLTKARSIKVRTATGEVIAFDMTRMDGDAQFPAGHLAEHQVTAEPVLVVYVEEAGTRFALRLDDVSP